MKNRTVTHGMNGVSAHGKRAAAESGIFLAYSERAKSDDHTQTAPPKFDRFLENLYPVMITSFKSVTVCQRVPHHYPLSFRDCHVYYPLSMTSSKAHAYATLGISRIKRKYLLVSE